MALMIRPGPSWRNKPPNDVGAGSKEDAGTGPGEAEGAMGCPKDVVLPPDSSRQNLH